MEIDLPSLARAIADCWTEAEQSLADLIARKYPDPAEENITFLLAGELREAAARASQEDRFARAFEEDLQLSFPQAFDKVAKCSEGLIARVDLHKRHHEARRSGADFGLVTTQPSVVDLGLGRIQFLSSSSRALLAQAKLNTRPGENRRGVWRPLTKSQEKLLPLHGDYYSFVLYYLGGDHREQLSPLRWQLCADHSVTEIKTWLRSGEFPETRPSLAIVEELSLGGIGTSSTSVIEKIIAPSEPGPNVIEFRLFWPDDPHPAGSVIEISFSAEQQRVLEVNQHR